MNRHILIDENIPLAEAAFAELGTLERFSGRELSPAQIQRADALIVRSITRVDQNLLQGSKVSFVGTCTIGVDHLAVDELHQMGVSTTSAPGCNANSVVEYVLSALVALGEDWQRKKCMIIGCGNVGHRLAERLQALGADVSGYDPFLSKTDRPYLSEFSDIESADIICVHTPYTRNGEFPTHHLLNFEVLSRLKSGAVLINAGRGGAVDNSALLQVIKSRSDLKIALDVWENEPHILPELMDQVDLATPHIAGYSWDGKAKGTWQVAQALEKHWQSQAQAEPSSRLTSNLLTSNFLTPNLLTSNGWQNLAPAHEAPTILLSDVLAACPEDVSYMALWQRLLSNVYDVQSDDQRLRRFLGRSSILGGPTSRLETTPEKVDNPLEAPLPDFGALTPFDYLRKHYPVRREWQAFTLDFSGWDNCQEEYRQRLWKDATIMGFNCL